MVRSTRKKTSKVKLVLVVIMLMLIGGVILNHGMAVKYFFPYPYQEQVELVSEEFGIDPYLVLAVIKAESKFREDAVSPKGAIGLMQVMPTTGMWIAEQLKLEDFQPDDLYDPELNILFGSWYLSFVLREFNQNTPAALAGYNAGPGKVKEWLGADVWNGSYTNLVDIPYKETRDYVGKVSFYLQMYQRIYDEN